MAEKKFFVDLGLNLNQLLQARVENVTALPTTNLTNQAGRMVYLATDKHIYQCNGVGWQKLAEGDDAKVALAKDSTGLVYTLTQGGAEIGTINIPKDMVVKSGSVVAGTWSGNTFTENTSGKDKALKLVIANSTDVVYINVADLVDAYTGGTSADITVAISNTNQITATLSQTVKNQLASIANKVDKVTGKGLSTNDYTTADKNKLASLRQALAYQSAPLEGDSGEVALDGFEYNVPVIMQATKAGEEIGISMTYEVSSKAIKWASNTKFAVSDNVTITAIQVQ